MSPLHHDSPESKKSKLSQEVFGEPALERTENGFEPSESAQKQIEGEGDPNALDEAGPFPEEVYDLLPTLLREPAAFFEGHRRDVFLTGALPLLAGCMPNYKGEHGQPSESLTPNFYATVIAGAAGGKSVLQWGRRLVEKVDEHLREASRAERQRWEKQRRLEDSEKDGPSSRKPPQRSLILPPDMSAAGFHQALQDRNGQACIFGTEIDTLVNALDQDWGRFDADLRKAYHHERISSIRAGKEELSVRDPQLSLVLSGTQRQFRELIKSTENGLYSRLAVYYFDVYESWRSQQPADDSDQREECIDRAADEVKKLYLKLAGRDETLKFVMKKAHWRQHDEVFGELYRRAYVEGHGHLVDVVKRSGVIAFRIAMTLCLIRFCEKGVQQLGEVSEVTAFDNDVEAALALARCYADHALRFSHTLKYQPSKRASAYRIGELFRLLSDEFSNMDVYRQAVALGLGVTRRTLRRDLEKAADIGLITPVKRSRWKKT